MAPKTERFEMRLSPELLAAIDEWRRHQPDIPTRAEAFRRLQAVRAFEELRGDGHIGVSENHKVRGFMVVDRPEWAK